MKRHRVQNLIVAILFGIALGIFFIINVKGTIFAYNQANGDFEQGKLQAETYLMDNVRGKGMFTEIYGTMHNLIGLDVIGAFEFIRDDVGIMQRIETEYNCKPFIDSVKSLSATLNVQEIPLLYVQLPDRGKDFQFKHDMNYFGKIDARIVSELKNMGIDILDLGEALNKIGVDVSEDYFFVSDVHLTTKAEYLNAMLITKYLTEKYQLDFPLTEQVYNENNWDWVNHPFWGNLGRSAGKIFSGTDIFTTFIPRFETKLQLTIPQDGLLKKGSFLNVLTNGYDTSGSKDSYWVTNYGQWPSPLYFYENMLIPQAPRLLVISDSIMLRANTFLSMNASSVTVLDPRSFNNVDYLAECLSLSTYDAVIICASDLNFYSLQFESDYHLNELRVLPSQTQGYSGMWLDTCNGQPVSEQGSIHDFLFESNDFVALEGWAADFSTMQPLSDLYLQIGDVVLQCQYGLPRDSVSSYFGTDSLLHTGFTITFPAAYLQEQPTAELQFIQVGTDGTYQYAPVQYSINRQNIFNSIPLTTEQQPANNLWIDDCNGVAQPEERLVHMNLNGREQIDLTGWSADLLRSTPLGALYVQVGEQIFPCEYGGERLPVAEYFQNDALKNVGFTVSIPVEAFYNGAIEQLQFIAVTQDGVYRYENIPYRIAYDAPDVSQGQETPDPNTENELSGASAKTLLMFTVAIGLFLLAAGYLINGKQGESLQRLGQNSFLFTELVKRDFTLKYKRTILGMFWSILSPLLNLLIMWLVFSKLLGSNIDHFVVYLFAGQLVFNYFSDATNLGMTSLLDNAEIFTKVNVPKYLFLFSRNVSALINFILTLFIFFFFVALEGIPFSMNFLTLLYPIFCLVVLNLGVGMILSALYVFFRDMRYLWGVAIQLLTWMSAIFYSIDAFDEPVRRVFLLNPIYLCIRYVRKVVLEGTVPTIQFHLLLATFSVGIFFVGCFIYKKKNHEFLYYV